MAEIKKSYEFISIMFFISAILSFLLLISGRPEVHYHLAIFYLLNFSAVYFNLKARSLKLKLLWLTVLGPIAFFLLPYFDSQRESSTQGQEGTSFRWKQSKNDALEIIVGFIGYCVGAYAFFFCISLISKHALNSGSSADGQAGFVYVASLLHFIPALLCCALFVILYRKSIKQKIGDK